MDRITHSLFLARLNQYRFALKLEVPSTDEFAYDIGRAN